MNGMKTHILFTSSTSHIAGAETNLISLLNTLDRDHFYPVVIYNPDSSLEKHFINKEGITLLPISLPKFQLKNILSITTAILRLIHIIIRFKIDVIYFNSIFDMKYFNIIFHLIKIPSIAHIHVDEDDDSLRWAHVANADIVLFPSQSTMNSVLLHSPWLKLLNVDFVHNGIDVNMFYPRNPSTLRQELGFTTDSYPIIGIVGQVKEIKGQHIFIEACARLKRQGINAHYLIAGRSVSNESNYMKYLKQLVIKSGLEKNLHFLGFRNDVPVLMSGIDLLVVPSSREPFGRVIIEAMACGTPVVASAVDGIMEIFKEGDGGVFFPLNDLDVLVDKIKAFLSNPHYMREQSTKALELARNKYDQMAHTNKIANIISSMKQN